jgi:hypothetical protein
MPVSKLFIFFAALSVLSCGSIGRAQTGGDFAITQSVVASGGQISSGVAFTLDGTIGQPLAGNALNGSPFAVTSGFHNFSPLAPTAATVTVGGRVLTTNGRGIRNVLIVMTNANGAIRTVLSSAFGYYQFIDVAAGETYIFTARGKRFSFTEPTRVVSISEDITDLNFIAVDNKIPTETP